VLGDSIMAKQIVPQAIKNLPSRLMPRVSEQEYIEMQKGVRSRFEIISNILSGIVQNENQKKRQSEELKIEGAPESTPAFSAAKKTKSLLPESASTGLAFAAGALAVYFISALDEVAENLITSVKKMLGFDVESSNPEKGLLDDSLDMADATEDEKEIEKEISEIESRPGKEDNEIFKSGPNDDTIEQLTDNIEDETDNTIDNTEDDTQPDEESFPNPDDTDKEIEKTLNDMENEVEDESETTKKDTSDARYSDFGELGNLPPPRRKKDTSESKKVNKPKAKDARAKAREERKAIDYRYSDFGDPSNRSKTIATPPPSAPTPSAAGSSSAPTGEPVRIPKSDDRSGDPEKANISPAPKDTSTGTASKSLVDLIKGFEGFSPKAYPDYAQYSNGYGTKAKFPTEEITEEEAERRLMDEIAKFSGIVERFNSVHKKYNWNSNQKNALTSFIYNLGPGALDQVTDNGKRDNDQIADAMLQYNKAGGRVLSMLTRRRRVEADLFKSSAGVDESKPTSLSQASPPATPTTAAAPIPDPITPTTKGDSVAAASAASDASDKESEVIVLDTPPKEINSGKTTGNQPKADITLIAANLSARQLAATHGMHSYGQTGTGTVAQI